MDLINDDPQGIRAKPTLRTYEMICLYLQDWADEDELLAHLKKLKPCNA